MPAPSEILDLAALIANEWRWLAAAWHAAILLFLIDALVRRTAQPATAAMLALPMISVSAMAGWSANPFNSSVFLVLAVLLAVAARRMDKRPVAVASPPLAAAGLMLFAFGFVYPHFLVAQSWMSYLVMSPFGLLPCPTLAAVTGISLIFGMFGSRRWTATLMVTLLAYGIIGVAVLGVWMDTMLIAGAVMLLLILLAGQRHLVLGG